VHNKAVRLDLGGDVWFKLGEKDWQQGSEVSITQEGINSIFIKKSKDAAERTERKIGYRPHRPGDGAYPLVPNRSAGKHVFRVCELHFFTIEARDELSKVKLVEYSVDEGKYIPYVKPFTLASGHHVVRFVQRIMRETSAIVLRCGAHRSGGKSFTNRNSLKR